MASVGFIKKKFVTTHGHMKVKFLALFSVFLHFVEIFAGRFGACN
jgi:hypothetical protein